MKKAFILLVALLILLFSFLNAVPTVQEETDVEQLIDKASYCYGILEDYPRALKYLNRAVELAGHSYLKADALVRTAYVYFLMGKNVSRYKEYILEALKIDSSIKLDKIYYRERFIKIFNTIKEKPRLDAKAIQTKTLPPEVKSKRRGRFFIKGNVDYLSPVDTGYKEVYGSGSLFIQVKAGFRLARNFYVWAGYGAISAKGTIPELESSAKANQAFLLFGLKYTRDFSKKMGYKIEAAIASVKYKEEALEMEVTESTQGFSVETGLVFNLGKRFFSELSIGHLYATDVLPEKKVKIGGFMAGLGLGVKL
jgi:tetratricopeptide (TPR) repeat protein